METDQDNKLIMSMALPGMKAPEFAGITTGPKGHNEMSQSFPYRHMSLKDFTSNGSWCLLFFFLDFGYISPSELLALNSFKKDLDNLKCNLLVCSTDTAVIHKHKFLSLAPEEGGVKGLSFPLLEDVNGNIAEKYGVLRKDSGNTFRGYFLIDSKGIVRIRTIYDLPVGMGCEKLPETIKAVQDALNISSTRSGKRWKVPGRHLV